MMPSPRVKGGENRGRSPPHRASRGPLPPPRGVGWGALLLAALVAIASPALAKPQRVVSLNLCADELALRLADPGVVKSVTWLSQDPRNANMAAEAAALPANDGHAEEALAYDPDLVLVGPFADPASIALLKRSARRSAKSARRKRSTACAARSAISPPRSASRNVARR